jgi:hypothetical protein
MRSALPTPLQRGSLPRYVLLAAGMVLLFRFGFDQTWPQVAVVTVVVLFAEVADLSRALGGLDPRYVRGLLGLCLVGAGLVAVVRGPALAVAAVGIGIGWWVLLDAAYALHAGREPDGADADLDASEAMLRMQVARLLVDELRGSPKTVPELAAACDTTESRVHAALELLACADTAHCQGEAWVLDEGRIGLWPFVRDNTRRVVARLARPFRLFVPG